MNQLVAVFSLGKEKLHPTHFPKNPLFLLLKWKNLPCYLVSFIKIRRKSIQDIKPLSHCFRILCFLQVIEYFIALWSLPVVPAAGIVVLEGSLLSSAS